MPKVGGKHFSYTKQGYGQAREHAKKTGKKVDTGARKAAAQRLAGKMKRLRE